MRTGVTATLEILKDVSGLPCFHFPSKCSLPMGQNQLQHCISRAAILVWKETWNKEETANIRYCPLPLRLSKWPPLSVVYLCQALMTKYSDHSHWFFFSQCDFFFLASQTLLQTLRLSVGNLILHFDGGTEKMTSHLMSTQAQSPQPLVTFFSLQFCPKERKKDLHQGSNEICENSSLRLFSTFCHPKLSWLPFFFHCLYTLSIRKL